MSIYAYPETQYQNLSKGDLHALFSTEQWVGLTPDQRMDACQEVVNRFAEENNAPACTITSEPMNGSQYGYQSHTTICLNSHLLNDCQFVTKDEESNTTFINDVAAPGWNTLDTVYHEGTHGLQEAEGRMPDEYIDSDKHDYDLYRIQGIEKEAFEVGQQKTLEALAEYEKSTGKIDIDKEDYLDTVRSDSFQAALQNAAKNYNDPNIEKTVNDVIYDRDHGITNPNPSPSYEAINSMLDNGGKAQSPDQDKASAPDVTADPSGENGGMNAGAASGLSLDVDKDSDPGQSLTSGADSGLTDQTAGGTSANSDLTSGLDVGLTSDDNSGLTSGPDNDASTDLSMDPSGPDNDGGGGGGGGNDADADDHERMAPKASGSHNSDKQNEDDKSVISPHVSPFADEGNAPNGSATIEGSGSSAGSGPFAVSPESGPDAASGASPGICVGSGADAGAGASEGGGGGEGAAKSDQAPDSSTLYSDSEEDSDTPEADDSLTLHSGSEVDSNTPEADASLTWYEEASASDEDMGGGGSVSENESSGGNDYDGGSNDNDMDL